MRHSILYILSLRFSKILSSRLCLHVLLKDFSNKSFMHFFSHPCLLYAPPNWLDKPNSICGGK
jgi:hypothetical protein